ncbi:MAG TPA: Cof-type HAD-IIB family hydrolase [Bacillus sp. (in: firmicutes)]|uniref:Cof-type HAD-IIB family hydrolase n=1 Tax=Bacillus litorisediminis TaxID=2922713 RepID=UPI001FABF81D|nr:Cof-type HAD-IIB family hydrolase [Bacillus litorisediminis]HWO77026.1 Cof-type HAD-IIB family hydrolase [Bacillus sp. (in: firmicutes)]
MLRCIATDMDGTLLNSNQKISKENETALKLAQEKGIEVVVATGRSYYEAASVLEEAKIVCPIICVNGAEIRNSEGEKIFTNPIPAQLAKRVMKQLDEMGYYYELYSNSGTYTRDSKLGLAVLMDLFQSANRHEAVPWIKMEEQARKRFEEGVKIVDDYGLLVDDKSFELYKILVFSKDHEALQKAGIELEDPDLAITSSAFGNIEINYKTAQKGVALEAFVQERGISLAETLAIGDQLNDLSMLEIVGTAVAMGNAAEEIKQIAHYITATNNENGVALAITKYMNLM